MQGFHKALRHRSAVDHFHQSWSHQREFRAAHPRQGVPILNQAIEAARSLDQEGIAGGVAVGVIDVLETIETDHVDGDVAAVSLGQPQRLLEAVGKDRPVD